MSELQFNNNQYPPIGNFAVGTVTASQGSVQFSNSNGVTFGMNSAGVVTASVAAGGGGGVVLGVPGTSISSGTGVFSNSNGVSFGINGQTLTGSFGLAVSAAGGTSNNASGVTFANANGVSFGLSTGAGVVTLTASHALNVSAAGGTSNALSGLTFINSNGVSFGLSTGVGIGSLSASHAINVSAGAGTSNALSAITFANSNGITFGLSTGVGVGTITASFSGVGNFSYSNLAGAGGLTVSTNGISATISEVAISRFIWPQNQIFAVTAPGQGSVSIQYVPVPTPVSGTRVDALVLWVGATTASAVTMGIAMSVWVGISTRNGATLSSLSSGSTQTTYTYASNNGGQSQLTAVAMRPISCPVNFNMSQGEYFVGFNFSTNTTNIGGATTNLAQTLSMVGGQQLATLNDNYAEFNAATAQSTGLYGGMGVYTAQTAGMPTAVSLSAINQTGSALSAANVVLVFRNV